MPRGGAGPRQREVRGHARPRHTIASVGVGSGRCQASARAPLDSGSTPDVGLDAFRTQLSNLGWSLPSHPTNSEQNSETV